MLYETHYDEINAELQQMAAIAREEETKSIPRINIGSGEDQTFVFFGHNLKEIQCAN